MLIANMVMAINMPSGHELIKQEGNYYTARNNDTQEINTYYIEGEPATTSWQARLLDDSVIFQQVYYLDAFLFYKIFVHDFNGNGKPEFFAADMGEGVRTRFFENQGDFNFTEVHRIEEPMATWGFGDTDNDGLFEILTQATDTMRLIEQEQLYNFPGNMIWDDTSMGGPYISYAKIGDINGNGIPDITFVPLHFPRQLEFFENNGNNSFVHKSILWQSGGLADYAYSDYDNDNKNEIVSAGPTPNEIKILEYVGNDSFAPVWQADFGCPNPYLHEAIGDNNGNSYGEWVSCGRDFSRSGFFFKVFEATGDNQYQVVYYDSLPGDCWEDGGLAHGDIDNDGRNEFMVSANSNIGLYKYDTITGWHLAWLLEGGGPYTTYPNLLDVDNDGECEIVISGGQLRSRIYNNIHSEINWTSNSQNNGISIKIYPNPSNSSIIIAAQDLANFNNFKIYDITGRLIRNEQSCLLGKYKWDLNDNEGKAVSSGIYFFVISIEGRKTVNRVLILR